MRLFVDSTNIGLGCYGIRLRGLDGAADLLVELPDDAPEYAVAAEIGRAADEHEHVDDERAELRLRSGGQIVVDRNAQTVLYRVPHPVRDDELVHPYLAPAAAVINRWQGRESIHAGAFAVDGRALGVVGTREAGKSSTLAYLALNGTDVLCDDMLIVDGDHPLAGPRSIDLRADAAQRFEAGEAIGMTGRASAGDSSSARPRQPRRSSAGSSSPGATRSRRASCSARERIPRIAEERGLRLPPVAPGLAADAGGAARLGAQPAAA